MTDILDEYEVKSPDVEFGNPLMGIGAALLILGMLSDTFNIGSISVMLTLSSSVIMTVGVVVYLIRNKKRKSLLLAIGLILLSISIFFKIFEVPGYTILVTIAVIMSMFDLLYSSLKAIRKKPSHLFTYLSRLMFPIVILLYFFETKYYKWALLLGLIFVVISNFTAWRTKKNDSEPRN